MINCKFENGNKASLRHVTVGLIAVKGNQILLEKRAMHLTNPGLYCIPGGYLDRDETLKDAVIRELLEETGYEGKIIKLIRIVDTPNRPKEDRQNVDFVYLVEVGEKVGDGDNESSEVSWFDLNNLPPAGEFAFDHYEDIEYYLQSC